MQDLLDQAEALITLYGPLKVDCGVYAFAAHIIRPSTLVELRLSYPEGLIMTAKNVPVMQWGRANEPRR